jgi:glutamyl-Q tRNA(Asp) synthetase
MINTSAPYRGRFAPSPTGPLHFGSLVAAVGSYLDARSLGGAWLVRMEDVDVPRCVSGAADAILRTLEVFGLDWDGEVVYQSRRTVLYEEAFQRLRDVGAAYPCGCTRKEIADSVLNGVDGPIYPGMCRDGLPVGREGRAWRVRTSGAGWLEFEDGLQGRITQNVEFEIGDFVVKRADGLFAYQLAVVVDDAAQGVTHVVRGADLLASTPRQIWLQRLLGLPTPIYMHLPVAVNAQGEKLSKQTLAAAIDRLDAAEAWWLALSFLCQAPPPSLRGDARALRDWAIANWEPARLQGVSSLPALA